jgi:hypothetical protein
MPFSWERGAWLSEVSRGRKLYIISRWWLGADDKCQEIRSEHLFGLVYHGEINLAIILHLREFDHGLLDHELDLLNLPAGLVALQVVSAFPVEELLFMVGDDPGVRAYLISLVPLLGVTVEQSQNEVLGRARDIFPLLVGELYLCIFDPVKQLLFVFCFEGGFPAESTSLEGYKM